jgi:heptosyltransferase I
MPRILVVRLGAMGDVIHALPAVATLKRGLPEAHVTWVIDRKWAPLLEANPDVDEVIPREIGPLRRTRPDLVVDFQGLIKSALVSFLSGARRRIGFDKSQLREPLARLFYTSTLKSSALHVVDRYVDLALGAGAASRVIEFPMPEGEPEGVLPDGPFVLASPLAGWGSKQWPLDRFADLAARLDVPLVVNGPPGDLPILRSIAGAVPHCSGISGLIYATRRASAVVGVDSGPLHVAAALGKPGVAIFGPTEPARNGPYGGTIQVLRSGDAQTTYKRRAVADPAMQSITVDQVLDALSRMRRRV